MEMLKDILLHIISYIIWGGIFIGLIIWVCVMIRFMIGTIRREPFDPFGRMQEKRCRRRLYNSSDIGYGWSFRHSRLRLREPQR